MIYIGIAIVKVFTMNVVYGMPASCSDPGTWVCPAVGVGRVEPWTVEKGVYTGEFDSGAACQRTTGKNHYVLEPGEDFVAPQLTQIICVPKFSVEKP